MRQKGNKIAIGALIAATLFVCALFLGFSPMDVDSRPAQASATHEFQDKGAPAKPAQEKAEAATLSEQPSPAPVEAIAQPNPATAAPQPVAQPAPAVSQPVDSDPKDAAQEPPEGIQPPVNLAGALVTKVPPFVELKWELNNSPSVVDYCLVYREIVEQPGELAVAKAKFKDRHEDQDIKPGLSYRYWVTVVSKMGEESKPSNTVEIVTYVMDPPASPQGLMAAAIDPGVSLDWQPNKEANLAGYNVYYSFQGRWRKINRAVVTDNHFYYQSGTAGQTFAVAAVNVYGIESGYATVTAQVSAPVVYQESDAAVSVEGFWASENYEGASGGSIRVALDAGCRLHFRFQGRQVKFIAAKYWSCGSARLYIDGELMATVNLYSAEPAFQSVGLSVPGLKYGTHVLTVEVVGSGNPEGEFNFVNADAFEVR